MKQNDMTFVNVSVIPMDREQVISGQTLWVRDERIVAMGTADQVEVPAGAEVIDGAGKYLMPGLADMHAHVFDPAALESLPNARELIPLAEGVDLQQLLLFVANGVTTIRDTASASDNILRLREGTNRGELLGPRIFTGSAPMDGDPPLLPVTKPFSTAEAARQYVRETADKGYDFVKIYSTLPVEIFDAIMESAAEVGLPVAGHLPMPVDFEHALKKGMRSIEHLSGYDVALLPDKQVAPTMDNIYMGHAFGTQEKIRELARLTATYAVWNTPTLVIVEGVATDYGRPLVNNPRLRYMHPFFRQDDFLYEVFDARNRAVLKGCRDVRLALVRELKKAGAPLLIGTDTPATSQVVPGFSVHDELALFVEAGLSPYEALEAATAEPARYFDREGEFGTVQTGAVADLILLEANPLRDITRTQRRAGVMVRGQWFPESELQSRLEEMVASFPTLSQ
ncbi:MAG: amidohydrolase family protein [Deltaproteobacteria bacterium]|nr:amidohydrolase family protein [Deltaproteobacteria bacterium]